MAELPKIRLIPYEPPFTNSGVDYFGPFYVKRGRGKVAEKRWGAIFVCMNSRAVHLEVAKSLETDDFILLLMRFLNRRGHVKELRSDNGTNFVGADREIKEAIKHIDDEKVRSELLQRGCKWVFHPPGASHMSGVWERLVKSVKRSLKAIIGKDLINEEVLQTVFTEAERIANSRPLTRNSSSPDDDERLTTSHFLNIRPIVNLPQKWLMTATGLVESDGARHSSYQTTIGSVGLGSTSLLYNNAKSGTRHKGTCKLESLSLLLMIMSHDISGQSEE